jgi:Flp pilus assembly protein TadB
MTQLAALAIGVLVASPLIAYAHRWEPKARARRLTRRRRTGRVRWQRSPGLPMPSAFRTVWNVVRAPARNRQRRRGADRMAGEVAVAVDVIGVAVAAGCTPFLAMQLSRRWTPADVSREIEGVLRSCALGQAFDDALRECGRRSEPMRPLTEALRTSARLGAPVAPSLARLAGELRADLRRRAETRARTVPVRLCFPLVGCILPAFALLTVVPVVIDGIRR